MKNSSERFRVRFEDETILYSHPEMLARLNDEKTDVEDYVVFNSPEKVNYVAVTPYLNFASSSGPFRYYAKYGIEKPDGRLKIKGAFSFSSSDLESVTVSAKSD